MTTREADRSGTLNPLVLTAGDARLEVSPADGGRIRSLVVAGRELLVTAGDHPIGWGCYPMAPWAGRIRAATLRFEGREHRLPANEPPHALHGTVFDRPWRVDGPAELSAPLGERWPFPGRVIQRFALERGALHATLELHADAPMPAVLGWHPWFRRRLADPAGREPSPPVRLDLQPARMYERDAAGIVTGRLVPPAPAPWDDCFTGLAAAPVLTWPGVLALRVESDLDHWVVYTRPAHAVCVEPQSGPPNGPNVAPRLVRPGEPLRASMTWRWWTPAAAADGAAG